MEALDSRSRFIADVKCYYCGHISGQVIAYRGVPLTLSNFRPRPGYTGPEPRPGVRLRCERCHGPVFLEEAPPTAFNAGSPLNHADDRKPAKRQAA